MDTNTILEGVSLMKRGQAMLDRGPLEFYLQELCAAYQALTTRFAPFKTGDRVRLCKAPEINEQIRPGWISYVDLLVPGAIAEVRQVQWSSMENNFTFELAFDNNSSCIFSFSQELGDLEIVRSVPMALGRSETYHE